MGYHTKIIFGKDQIKKHHNDKTFTDCEKVISFKEYAFDTRDERSAFYKGIAESMGRFEFEVIGVNSKIKIIKRKKKKKPNLIIGHL